MADDDSKRIPVTLRVDPAVWEKVSFIAEVYRWSKNTAVEEMLKKAAGMRTLIDEEGKVPKDGSYRDI